MIAAGIVLSGVLPARRSQRRSVAAKPFVCDVLQGLLLQQLYEQSEPFAQSPTRTRR